MEGLKDLVAWGGNLPLTILEVVVISSSDWDSVVVVVDAVVDVVVVGEVLLENGRNFVSMLRNFFSLWQ